MPVPSPSLPNKTACRIYGIKNCDTVKKALAWFDERGLAYELIDYKKAGVAGDRLPSWTNAVGWQTLLNTRGLMWKKLSEAERVDADKALRLMTAYPALIKRPVIEFGDKVAVGFDPERYAITFAA
jgi:arsenate reductase (glutaredoxin)